jgi:hypothetical protein
MGERTEAPGARVREYELVGGPFCGDRVEVEDPPVARIRVSETDRAAGYYCLDQIGTELVYVFAQD